jgi:6-phosphofructokinase 1
MKRIAILASGGDAPGMNACVRAIVRAGSHRGLETLGVKDGYDGLLNRQLVILHRHDVSNIIQRGGVFLGSLRCKEFYTPEGRARGAEVLRAFNVDGLVAIGGDGTLRGARALHDEHGIACMLVPATIDNDAPASDWCIGFDTAVNTAVEAIDRLRDTAEATERVFFVEVMGRESGALALHAGLSAGADAILVPELKTNVEELADLLNRAILRRSRSLIVVVAEGQTAGGAFAIAEQVRPLIKLNYRVTVLGHVQRGGTPSARDRLLASRLGIGAVQALIEGKTGHVVGEIDGDVRLTSFEDLKEEKRQAPLALLQLLPDLF